MTVSPAVQITGLDCNYSRCSLRGESHTDNTLNKFQLAFRQGGSPDVLKDIFIYILEHHNREIDLSVSHYILNTIKRHFEWSHWGQKIYLDLAAE